MVYQNIDNWIREEVGSDVLNVVNSTSALEALGRKESMNSATKLVPRAGGVDVFVTAKGDKYTESSTDDGEVLLTARKFATSISLTEEDLADSSINVIAARQKAWANSYARTLDNACLGVTAAEDGTTTAPFTSVYKTLSTADAAQGYTANQNIIQTGGAVTYADLSSVIGLMEESDYFGELVVIAHPAFKGALRNVKDDNGNAVYLAGVNNSPDSIFGYPVSWSQGAKTSATNTPSPNGNPLLVVAEKSHLILGVRSGPESTVIDGFNQTDNDTDVLKMRSRRGFALGTPLAASILEVTAAPAV